MKKYQNDEYLYRESLEMAKLVMKYSKRQLINMVDAVDVVELQQDMAKNGATKEEILHTSESFHDILTILHGDIIY